MRGYRPHMALTQSDVDALDRAIATAELEVEVDGRRVRYRSMSDLMAARAHAASLVSAGSVGTTRVGVFRFSMTTSRE